MYHLLSNWNFRKVVVNGKQPSFSLFKGLNKSLFGRIFNWRFIDFPLAKKKAMH